MSKKFRKCAGAVVFNKSGKVLLGNRADIKEDSWQFPQGGIEQGETPEKAAKRELFEETSITSVETIYVSLEPIRYEFSEEIKKNFRKRGIFNDGQDIYFSLFYFTGNNDEINVLTSEAEFKDYMWGDIDFAVENIITFKKDAYALIAEKFKPMIARYLKELS